MKKNLLLIVFISLCIPYIVQAQFATGGAGKYTKNIFWLTWYWGNNAQSGLQSFTPSSSPSVTYKYSDATKAQINVDAGRYVWQISEFIRVEGILSNKVGTIIKYSPNSYATSGFQYMYAGFANKNLSIGNTANNNTPVGFDLILNVQVLRNNVWTNIDYTNHGVVFAETESLSETTEYIECLVDAKSKWYLIESSDTNRSIASKPYITDCGFKITSNLETRNSKEYRKVRMDNLNAGGQFGRTALLYAHGVNQFKDLRLVGQGITHLALGYFINHDISNAPNYEGAFHLQELVTSTNPVTRLVDLDPVTRLCDKPVMSIPDAKLTTTVYIGNPPNVENHEDQNNNLDGITQSVAVKANVNTDLTMKFTATNTLPNTVAYAYVWLDKNNDNIFSVDEGNVFTIAANSKDIINTIEYKNLNLSTGNYTFRIRITSDLLEDISSSPLIDERSVKMASNGEVTDYIINVIPQPLPLTLITFGGKVAQDHNKIEWTTAKESELKYYELQSSTDGINWKTIELIAAKNVNRETNYSTNDYELASQKLYRLHIIEENSANNSYSRIIKLIRKMEQNIVVYPNPTSEAIQISNVKEGDVIIFSNTLGQVVKLITAQNQKENISVQNFTKGTYIVTISDKNQQLHQQTVVVK